MHVIWCIIYILFSASLIVNREWNAGEMHVEDWFIYRVLFLYISPIMSDAHIVNKGCYCLAFIVASRLLDAKNMDV